MPYRITVAGTILEGKDVKSLLRRAVEARVGKRSRRSFPSNSSRWSAADPLSTNIGSRGRGAQTKTASQTV